DLKKAFKKIFGSDFFQASERFAKKSTNLLEYDETKFFNPYVVRYRALSSKVELTELFQILSHISKYRGYKEFYLDNSLEEKDEETKKTYAAVGEAKREKLEEEVRKILIEQSKHYSQLPKIFEKSLEINRIRETRTDIEKIIFRQRDFEDGPTKIEPKNQEQKEIIH
ncbi:1674_t:CDS:2, partial [Racocetra persica]